MYDRILIPLDGSSVAATVTPLVATLAHRLGLGVVLLRVVPPEDSHDTSGGRGPGRDSELPVLQQLEKTADLFWQRGVQVEIEILPGHAKTAIVDYANSHDIGLIAMTTRGQSGLARTALGSTAREVIHLARCPLLLHAAGQAVPGEVRRILVPLDGSDTAERVLPLVHRLARTLRSEVVLTTAIPLLPPTASLAVGTEFANIDTSGDQEEAQAYLAQVANRLQADGIPVDTYVVPGDPAMEIARTAESTASDLVAMATTAPSGLERWLLGSVAEGVLTRSQVPLLLVPPGVTVPGVRTDDAGETSSDIDALIAQVDDPDNEIAVSAIRALGARRVTQAIPKLESVLHRREILPAASNALSQIGSPALDTLLTALRDPHEQVRWHAATAVADMQAPEAIPMMADILDDESPGVRWAAIRGLLSMDSDEVARAVLRRTQRGQFTRSFAHAARTVLSRLPGDLHPRVQPVAEALGRLDAEVEAPPLAGEILMRMIR
ncbi:MAG TPA: universal stress protein [Chloroflexota bacterium]|nr:universal stress protein [Chloroflexota bacterium]